MTYIQFNLLFAPIQISSVLELPYIYISNIDINNFTRSDMLTWRTDTDM